MHTRRDYPSKTTINGETYRAEKVLKEDFFSVNVLYGADIGRRWVLKLSRFRFPFGYMLRPLAALMSRHEYRIYARLADLDGVPRLGPRMGNRAFFHQYIEGVTLYELPRDANLPDDFFDRLRRLLDELHRRRIFYADLNKRGNIILGSDGRPYLIDFQISVHFNIDSLLFAIIPERVFRLLIRQDLYHLYKHKRRWQHRAMTDEELQLARRTGVIRKYESWFAGSVRRLKRAVYPKGGSDTIWYKWKNDKSASSGSP